MGPTAPDRTGGTFRDQINERILRLAQGILIELSDVGGTANAITAQVDPGLAAGLKAGMSFLIQTPLANTGAVTLRLYDPTGVTDLTGSVPVVDLQNVALTSGRFQANSFQEIVYSAVLSKFVLITDTRTNNRVLDYQAFTSSATWTKPAGTPANAWVLIRAWGAGGGGGNDTLRGGGGGGGAFVERLMRGNDLASSITVTVPAGGAVDSAGGNASFGSNVIAYGGGRGGHPTGTGAGGGGGGGGRGGVGGNGQNVSGISGGDGGSGGALGGAGGGGGSFGSATGDPGDGGTGTNDGNTGSFGSGTTGGFGGNAIDGGAGGGGGAGSSASGDAGNGGRSVRGGGGGGGAATYTSGAEGSGGVSIFGGNGGNSGAAGSVRGGGGGAGAAGGRGEVQVWVIS